MNQNQKRELDMCMNGLTTEMEVPEVGTVNFLGRGPEAILIDPEVVHRHYLLFFDPKLKIDLEYFIKALRRTWKKRNSNEVQIINPAYSHRSREQFLYIIEECTEPHDKSLEKVLDEIKQVLLKAKDRYLKILRDNTPPPDATNQE